MADGYITTPVGPFATGVGASFGTFTTRQDVSPLPVPVVLPFQLRLGSKIKMEAEGEFSSTGSPTIVLGFYYGITLHATSGAPLAVTGVLAESGAITVATGVAWPWRLEYRGVVTALGSTGSIVGQGDLEAGTSLTAFSTSAIPITQALRTVSIPTTGPLPIGVCATWSASSGSNTVRVNNFSVMLLN